MFLHFCFISEVMFLTRKKAETEATDCHQTSQDKKVPCCLVVDFWSGQRPLVKRGTGLESPHNPNRPKALKLKKLHLQ